MRFIKKCFPIILLLASYSGFAQLSHPHFISLNLGTSIPLSEYDQLDSSITADLGNYYSFEAGAYFSRVLGVALNIGAFNNNSDKSSIEENLKNDIRFSNGKAEVSSDAWSNGYIMLGPILSLGGNKFIVDLKVLGGLMNSTRPLLNIENKSLNNTYSRNSESNASTFGLNYGLHFRIKLYKKLGLRVNAEGFMANQEFETKVQENNGTAEPTVREEKVKQEISALNLGAGLILTF